MFYSFIVLCVIKYTKQFLQSLGAPRILTSHGSRKRPWYQDIEGRRRSGQQKMRWLDGIIDSMDMSLGKFWDRVKDRDAWNAAVHRVSKSWTWLSEWTTTTTNNRKQGWKGFKVNSRKIINAQKVYAHFGSLKGSRTINIIIFSKNFMIIKISNHWTISVREW